MNKLQLFRTLRRHIKLAEKRSVAYEQNRTAKVLLYIGGAFVILYLVFIAIMLAMLDNTSRTTTTNENKKGKKPLNKAKNGNGR